MVKHIWNLAQTVWILAGAYIGWFLGGFDGFLYTLIAFVVIDYITGLMCAIVTKSLSSEVGFRGIFKKCLIFMLVGIANLLDVYVLKQGEALRTATIFFYISNEGLSIVENGAILGLPIPDTVQKALAQIKDKHKED